MNARMNNALNQYTKVGTNASVAAANPHRLIQMLMDGALEKIAMAKGHMQRGEIEQKGRYINWAISIISGLASSLDKEKGGDLALRLDDLYLYMNDQLFKANLENKPEKLDEVSSLMREVKMGWDAIANPEGNPAANSTTNADTATAP